MRYLGCIQYTYGNRMIRI